MTRMLQALVLVLASAVSAGAQGRPPKATLLSASDSASLTSFNREVFGYDGVGRRDPFLSPIASGEARPMLVDLVVTGILFDPAGRSSVAVMRDQTDKQIYRVKVGESLGRARVTRIAPRAVYVTVDEFGFARSDSLVFMPTSLLPEAGAPTMPSPASPTQTRTP